MNRKPVLLLIVVFISGMTSLAIELTASRFIGNYFGSALPVWAAIIGMVLVYLTIGYILGGRLADRNPSEDYLYRITMWAGFFTGLVPFVANPILQFATVGIRDVLANVFVGSLLGVILLLSLPMVLLGCVSPFAIRLQTKSVESSGNTAGAIYALSTMGSILGTFLPVLILIPTIGTHNTFLAFSFSLMIPSLIGIAGRSRRQAWAFGALIVVILALMVFLPQRVIRNAEAGTLIYETESPYNYIQVAQVGDARYLMLNEGNAVHSIYDPNQLLTHGEWDYFSIAPYFYKNYSPSEFKRVAIIGLAAGTVPRQLTAIYGPIAIDGVEIDPTIVNVGRKYFDENLPNLNVIIQDGRYFMRTTDQKYDLIGVDAYHQPYIPAQLTTVEFFQEAYNHLTDRGAVLLNAGRAENDYRLLDALSATMKQVFPNVYIIGIPYQVGWGVVNNLIVGTKQPTMIGDFVKNTAQMTNPLLRDVAQSAIDGGIDEFNGNGLVFTDDKAPVELVIDQMILGYALGQP
jgi:predicted membrane-bound spermidine synthase